MWICIHTDTVIHSPYSVHVGWVVVFVRMPQGLTDAKQLWLENRRLLLCSCDFVVITLMPRRIQLDDSIGDPPAPPVPPIYNSTRLSCRSPLVVVRPCVILLDSIQQAEICPCTSTGLWWRTSVIIVELHQLITKLHVLSTMTCHPKLALPRADLNRGRF